MNVELHHPAFIYALSNTYSRRGVLLGPAGGLRKKRREEQRRAEKSRAVSAPPPFSPPVSCVSVVVFCNK